MQSVAEIAGTIVTITFWVTLYFLPSIMARKKTFALQLFLLNFFAGWTIIGWIVALIWAFKNQQQQITKGIANINAHVIVELEKFNRLRKNEIITDEEFAVQKLRLLGPQGESKPKKNNKVAIAVVSILIIGFTYTCFAFFSPLFYNEQTTVSNFLNNIQNQIQPQKFNNQAADYLKTITQKNVLPKITEYQILTSQEINSNTYHVLASIVSTDTENNQYRQNVTFLVEKHALNYYIKNSYGFLNTGTNKIAFPEQMSDIKRIAIAQQQPNLNVQMISSNCNIKNNGANCNVQIKNNYTLPVKNIHVQLQYLNKQQQTVKNQTINLLGNKELQPQETRTTNVSTENCLDCNSVNITLLTSIKN
jgi:T4 superinfection immunity protein